VVYSEYGFTLIRLAVVACQICKIPRNSFLRKFELITVQNHPGSSILVPIKANMQLPINH